MDQRKRATNIAQELDNEVTRAWLTVNGFTWNGSDYDRFRKLCVCADRSPDAPILPVLQEVLKTAFSCHLRIGTENCKEIWRITSEKLLLSRDPLPSVSVKVWNGMDVLPPDASDASNDTRFLLNGLQIQAETWEAWAKEARRQLQNAVIAGKHPTVWVSSDFRFQKPNLYRVERHLCGIEKDEILWMAQLVYFLCNSCAERDLRGVLLWNAELAELSALLRYVSKLTSLPNLCLRCDTANASDLLPICETVMQSRRGSGEGIPPVVMAKDQSQSNCVNSPAIFNPSKSV